MVYVSTYILYQLEYLNCNPEAVHLLIFVKHESKKLGRSALYQFVQLNRYMELQKGKNDYAGLY